MGLLDEQTEAQEAPAQTPAQDAPAAQAPVAPTALTPATLIADIDQAVEDGFGAKLTDKEVAAIKNISSIGVVALDVLLPVLVESKGQAFVNDLLDGIDCEVKAADYGIKGAYKFANLVNDKKA